MDKQRLKDLINGIRELHRELDDNTSNYELNQAVLKMGDQIGTIEEIAYLK